MKQTKKAPQARKLIAVLLVLECALLVALSSASSYQFSKNDSHRDLQSVLATTPYGLIKNILINEDQPMIDAYTNVHSREGAFDSVTLFSLMVSSVVVASSTLFLLKEPKKI